MTGLLARPLGRGRRYRNEGFEGDDDDCDYIVYVDYSDPAAPPVPPGQRRYRCVEDEGLFTEGEQRRATVSAAAPRGTVACGPSVFTIAAAIAGLAVIL